MKNFLLALLFIFSTTSAFSQSNSFWKKAVSKSNSKIKRTQRGISNPAIYTLDIKSLKESLSLVPKRRTVSLKSQTIISFPNSKGDLESYRVKEASVMHPDLQSKYSDIRSYIGQGINNPLETIRFSVSPVGLHSMTLSGNNHATFIEPYTEDLKYYRVYKRSERTDEDKYFECEVTAQVNKTIEKGSSSTLKNADDGVLRTYRLVVSTTGEYTQYHGGTKALALAAMNTTMTRVNGIFERDFNVTLKLMAATENVIYTNRNTDPYGNTSLRYGDELQSTLTSVVGEANYDIGHLFAVYRNSGNAGCIGCICVDGVKGSGWTSRTTPEGDPFDVDFVAHEMGHQFGGNHTWTHRGNEGTGVQVEPGSGSTIMGYAGITGPRTDVQSNSDPYFHAISIQQITNYIKTKNCQTNTNTGNAVPTADAGANYTIPKGTPFVLTGAGTDPNSGDILTYSWEQMNNGSSSTTIPSSNATSGPAFRAYSPTTDTKRYFPRLETIKIGATSWNWEALPKVARRLNFRLTVRDNVAGGANNNSDDMVVTVNGTAGPFVLNTPNTNVTWNAGTIQAVKWNVAGTTSNGVNAANVDIFLSTDGGDTYPIALARGVVNNGSYDVLIPNNQGTQNRIMVKGSNHIFFDISNTNFTIAGPVSCNAVTPTGLTTVDVNTNSATLGWNVVSGASSYDVRYRVVGSSSWTTVSVNGLSETISGLSLAVQYEAQVRSKCSNTSTSAYSSSVNFTTSSNLGCTGGISSYPYTESFENTFGAWTQSSNDDIDWTVNASGTPSSGTGPSSAIDGSYYIFVEASGNGTGYPNKRAIINSPCYDLSSLSEATFSFNYHMYGAADMGTIDLEASTDNGATWSSIWNLSGNKGNSWSVEAIDLGAYVGGNVQLRFNRFVGSTWQADIAIDNINLSSVGGKDTTAPLITLIGNSTINLNTGSTYTEQGASAIDNIDDDISGSVITGGDVVNTNTVGTYVVTYNVTDAAGNVAVEVIRTINVSSAASNVVLNEGFFETGLDGWTDGGTDCTRVSSTYSYEGDYSVRIRDNTGVASSMTLYNIDVTPFTEIEVSFYFYVLGMENNEDFWLRFYNGSSWNTIQTWTRGVNINNNTFYTATVSITPAQYNFAVNSGFRFQCDASGNNDRIFVDQVTITGISGTSKSRENSLIALGSGFNRLRSDSSNANFSEESDFVIHPNPVSGSTLNVNISGADKFSYRILNIIGQVVSQGDSQGTINVNSLQSGLYIIEINDGEEVMNTKFIKQ